MRKQLLTALLIIFTFVRVSETWPSTNVAYVSVLSSESFVLPAKVIAYRLRSLNASIPFVLLCTEDVSDASINALTDMGVSTRKISKLNTPFKADYPQAKFQYTKVRLWHLTEFTRLLYLDLDTLPLSDLAVLLQCGDFCASLRHSDKFNAGIFVMRPNATIYEQMIALTSKLDSYDGGDQGFLNSFFDDLKAAPQFDPKRNVTTGFPSLRLSAEYNYDIGMYYLTGRALVKFQIIHYTLGYVKPWMWWTYPVFDLNSFWLSARASMEKELGPQDNYFALMVREVVFLAILGFMLLMCSIHTKQPMKWHSGVHRFERWLVTGSIIVGAVTVSFVTTPEQMWPSYAWTMFTLNAALNITAFSVAYAQIRFHSTLPLSSVILLLMCIPVTVPISWALLHEIPNPLHRGLGIIFLLISDSFVLVCIVSTVLSSKHFQRVKYVPLKQ